MTATIRRDMAGRWGVWLALKDGRGELIYTNEQKKTARAVLKMALAMIKARAPGWRF